jgi:hypothetical protein
MTEGFAAGRTCRDRLEIGAEESAPAALRAAPAKPPGERERERRPNRLAGFGRMRSLIGGYDLYAGHGSSKLSESRRG